MTGISNRPKDWQPAEGPQDFDGTLRSTVPSKMRYTTDTHVPAAQSGEGNRDFAPALPGFDFRQPNSSKVTGTVRMQDETQKLHDKVVDTLVAPGPSQREARQKGLKVAPRWNPKRWYEPPTHEQAPLQKEEGEAWNSKESEQTQGSIKGQDQQFRSVRHPDVATACSEADDTKVTAPNEEYYPGRSSIDAGAEQPTNAFQVRPVHLPDFNRTPINGADSVSRMKRIRELLCQRFAGRPGLIKTFRNFSMTKPGYCFPKDLQRVMDNMGIKVSEEECGLIVEASDKERKGALTFQEFSDLIYGGSDVNVGGDVRGSRDREVRHITKTLVDTLAWNGPRLGKAFCEVDPDRNYLIPKHDFCAALGTACNHVSSQAVDFLWAAQFPGRPRHEVEDGLVDWRSFLSQMAHFAHQHRLPTPCCVQGRKRHRDLLQRTVALTGGVLVEPDLGGAEQDAESEVYIVGGRMVQREHQLPFPPREAAHLTESYVEKIRMKAARTEQALPQRLPQKRLRELLQNRRMVHQDELVALLWEELGRPGEQSPLDAQVPVYARHRSGRADVLTLDSEAIQEPPPEAAVGDDASSPGKPLGETVDNCPRPASLVLVKADVEAYVATQRTSKDHEVDVDEFIANVYRPVDERRDVDTVNDGLNRALRGHRPARQRPPDHEVPRYENYWHARCMMERLNDAIAEVEPGHGGKIMPSKVFKRLDVDGDGYISMVDLKQAFAKYKVLATTPDLHALFSALDRDDNGCVEIGEFTRHFELDTGSILDSMQRPIKAVYHEGGVEIGGPLQEALDRCHGQAAGDTSLVSGGSGGARRGQSAPRSLSSGTSRQSQMSRTGAHILQTPLSEPLVPGKARVTDVIRARCAPWKPHKSELFNTMPSTRFGLTQYHDTRHVTEANVPLSHGYMSDRDRLKTTSQAGCILARPDPNTPQVQDAMKRHATNEFRVERIRQRHRDFSERQTAANEATQEWDEQRIARKALNLINYERRVGAQ